MKISLNWIKEFTDVDMPVGELVEKIGAQLGEVEEVINLGEKYEGIVVAKVVSCEKHPNADKLSVCKINDGKKTKNVERDSKGLVQVVCGAPNVRAGITIAWIPPGVVVPSTFDSEQFRLETKELRGIVSNGMIASGKELSINDDHAGILVLDKPAEPGTPLSEIYKLDDYIIDVENKMFTHRPDCFGQLGVAREVAGITGLQFTSPEWYQNELDLRKIIFKDNLNMSLKVNNKLPSLTPRFMAVPISDVKIRKSPIMIQSFLSRIGVKPINNVVDITNFVMSLTAQPLHVYDFDKLTALDGSKTATLTVRHPKKGETVKLLNGKTVGPGSEAIMIASASELIGFGGVMGGTSTEVDNNTKNIVLECATFDMYSIRRTSMAHGLFTDAVTRYNKGQSGLQNDKVLAYAVAWIHKLAGGEVGGKIIDDNHVPKQDDSVSLTKTFINERLGLELSDKQITELLTNVEFGVSKSGKELLITPPFWRTDIAIAEDIVEEVGRLYGFDKLPLNLPQRSIKPVTPSSLLKTKSKIRSVLSSGGGNEVLTYSFVHGKLLDDAGQDKKQAYELSNALSPELQYYRLSLLPSLLDKVHANIKQGYSQFALFEVNKSHDKSNIHEDGLPIEQEQLALAFVADIKEDQNYVGSPYYQAQVYLRQLLDKFGIAEIEFEPIAKQAPAGRFKQTLAPFEPKRSALIKINEGIVIGVIGEVKPSVKRYLKLPAFTAGFELDVQLLDQYTKVLGYNQLSRFPSTTQDITFTVDSKLQLQALKTTVAKALKQANDEKHYDNSLKTHDIYRDETAKTKNITFRITLSHSAKTLVTEEVNSFLDDVATITVKQLGAKRV